MPISSDVAAVSTSLAALDAAQKLLVDASDSLKRAANENQRSAAAGEKATAQLSAGAAALVEANSIAGQVRGDRDTVAAHASEVAAARDEILPAVELVGSVATTAEQVAADKALVEQKRDEAVAAAASVSPQGLAEAPVTVPGGTVGRSIAERLASELDVREMGAVASGAADSATLAANEAAINAAIAAAPRIYIPPGCHYRRANLTGYGAKLIIDDSRGPRITSQDIDWQPKARPVELIAHRCWPYQAPENTLPAASRAVLSGARSLETDWGVTKDGYVVCHHDDTLDRCTSGALTGNIWDRNLSELRAVEFGAFFSASYAGTPILTADAFVKFAKSRGVVIYPEIKSYRTQADIDLMLEVVRSNDFEDMTHLSSFSISDLAYVREHSSRIGVILAASNLDNLEPLARLGRAQIWMPQATIMNNPSWVSTIRAAGVDVAAWTLAYNNGASAQDLADLGVFRLVANDIF